MMTAPRDAIDITNLPRFLKHLGHYDRDPMASKFAKQLLDEGGEVVVFWGPQQMDVWRLTIQRDGYLVSFGVERGWPDGVTLSPAADADEWPGAIPLRFAVFAWARAHAVELVIDDPIGFRVDLLAYGTAALDWLGAGHDDVLVNIYTAFQDGFRALGPIMRPEQEAERSAIQIRMMEDAAAAGTA